MGEDPNAIRAEIERTREEMGETVDALGYKADVKSRAKDKMTDTRDKITGKITGAKESVAGTVSDKTPEADQVKAQGRRAVGIAQENPLGLAIGGVAVGFIAGLLVPSTRVEDEKIGDFADQVKEQAKQTGQEALDRGKDVAQQAASSAAETAKETGQQQAQEMKDSTQERAQSVTS
jgi:gas vesicle protein